jgi:prepilin-type N-terminal cleavage/methylation domain-containing protein
MDKNQHFSGFTIVELLVVIVVIGILAAITIVSYNGINQKAIASKLVSDLDNNSKILEIYKAENNSYPNTLDDNRCPSAPVQDLVKCLVVGPDDTLRYTPSAETLSKSYSLVITSNNISYRDTSSSSPEPTLTCPSGFIVVPGSITYDTDDFCVMKFEAKNINNVATSQALGSPWVSINQASAKTKGLAVCAGCHLISEAEWMTIVQNVLGVDSNWSGGAVGSGYIFNGHNDTDPLNSLVADNNDSNGYINTSNSSGSQRRTLTLSNGEIIWDFAGNVAEITSGISGMAAGSLPGDGVSSNLDWSSPGLIIPASLSVNPNPLVGLFSGKNWTAITNGLGNLFGNSAASGMSRAFVRGGYWSNSSLNAHKAGVAALRIDIQYNSSSTYIGFRVAK